MPREQVKHKAPELDVPQPGEDPAERKRVLNVLAQRRYRQRKRDHLRKLEQRAQGQSNISDHPTSPAETATTASALNVETSIPQPPLIDFNSFDKIQPEFVNESDLENLFSTSDELLPSESDPSFFTCSPTDIWDTSTLFPMQIKSSSPSTDSTTTSYDSPDSSTASQSPMRRLSPLASSAVGFPDEVNLPVLELNLLKGALNVARRLNVDMMIWSLEACSPFYENRNVPVSYSHLPLNLQPTAVQKSTPHHPMIDILPWPSVRNKLIMILSQPEDMRPPVAASPTALMEFVYDFEDSAEGVRIWGDDPYSTESWEVGQQVFGRWWWVFDTKVIERSNLLRQQRGAARLSAQTAASTHRGVVLGEVT